MSFNFPTLGISKIKKITKTKERKKERKKETKKQRKNSSPANWTLSILLNSSEMGSRAFQKAEALSLSSFFLAELARSALFSKYFVFYSNLQPGQY